MIRLPTVTPRHARDRRHICSPSPGVGRDQASLYVSARPHKQATTLPGFIRSCGSSARLIALMTSMAVAPSSRSRKPSCPARRRARRCRCRPWPAPARRAASTSASRARDFAGSSTSISRQQMEIAVADMADNRRDEPALGDVRLRLGDAFGEPRDRHADIGDEHLRAGTQRERRPVGVVPRLPQPAFDPPRRVAHSNGPPPNSARSRRSAATVRRRLPACRGIRRTASATSGRASFE